MIATDAAGSCRSRRMKWPGFPGAGRQRPTASIVRFRRPPNSAATASSGAVNPAGMRPPAATRRPSSPKSRMALVAASCQRRSTASLQAGSPVAVAMSRIIVHRTTRSTIDPPPATVTMPSADVSRSISAVTAAAAAGSRRRQASMSRNSRARPSTNLAGSVSPAAKSGSADRASPTSRSSRPPAEPPARRARAIQASPHAAASQASQRSAGGAAGASSRHSAIAVSMNSAR